MDAWGESTLLSVLSFTGSLSFTFACCLRLKRSTMLVRSALVLSLFLDFELCELWLSSSAWMMVEKSWSMKSLKK
jgi:hypothetical protein